MIGNLQRIQIKVGCDAPPGLSLDPFIVIFGRWRKEQDHPAEWVDLADYAHVPRGPGIVLIGQRCNFAFDMDGPGPGILYAAKKGLTGSHAEKIQSALEWCLAMSKRLVGEPEFPSGVRLRPDILDVRFNDRLETPNTASTEEELRPALQQILDLLYGPQGYQLRPQTDGKQTFGFSIQARAAESLDTLLGRVAQSSAS